MKDLTSATWIKVKGMLFLLLGIASGTLLVLESRSWQVAFYLVIAIWCFCRCYYFAFYVIEKYVDSSYKFSGLWSFMEYWLRNRRKP